MPAKKFIEGTTTLGELHKKTGVEPEFLTFSIGKANSKLKRANPKISEPVIPLYTERVGNSGINQANTRIPNEFAKAIQKAHLGGPILNADALILAAHNLNAFKEFEPKRTSFAAAANDEKVGEMLDRVKELREGERRWLSQGGIEEHSHQPIPKPVKPSKTKPPVAKPTAKPVKPVEPENLHTDHIKHQNEPALTEAQIKEIKHSLPEELLKVRHIDEFITHIAAIKGPENRATLINRTRELFEKAPQEHKVKIVKAYASTMHRAYENRFNGELAKKLYRVILRAVENKDAHSAVNLLTLNLHHPVAVKIFLEAHEENNGIGDLLKKI